MKTKSKFFITAALALALVLSVTGVVMAAEYINIPLHNDTAEEGTDCPATGGPYWHFVISPNNGHSYFIVFHLNLGDAATYDTSIFVPNGSQLDNVFVAVPDGKTLASLNKEGSSADIYWDGEKVAPDKFQLSHVCSGKDYEKLEVSKTVVTKYTRTHAWDIAKKVTTEKGYKLDGKPKIWLYIDGRGDEKATWTVDVTYKGYTDSDFNVSGVITIKNTGTLDAVINSVDDVLAGAPTSVDCGDVTFPYTLPKGGTLTCTYDEDVASKIEGKNQVTVKTERDTYGPAYADIVWGAPTAEINKTVNVKDISDLFGEVDLGKVTAPDNATFTYTKDFAWLDYGADKCGHKEYTNTATIVETGQSASATLLVNVQCYVYETAYAKGGSAICFIPTFSNWGWTNPIMPGKYTWDLWAAAGQCDTSKGTKVGTVTVNYALIPLSTKYAVTVTYNVTFPYLLKETHVYAGYKKFPLIGKSFTVAPGLYTNMGPFNGTQVYVIAHAVVGLPDPIFGP